MDYIMSLPVDTFFALLLKAAEERRRGELRQEWLTMLPWMKNPKPFEQYYQERVQPMRLEISRRSAEDIKADVEAIRRAAAAQ